ncbi:MAG: 4-hydroxy-tetrahydrodipicolinate reductase, partial [Mariprofundaceae bacterium]|nr:4-hydroxy-tetrahydrodipicolinate reductase [Mariprofundaceae bacterium]
MRVMVTGASGRMGRMLVRAVCDADGVELVAATEREGSEHLGRDAGELAGIDNLGVPLCDGLSGLPQADGMMDFTAASATVAHAR